MEIQWKAIPGYEDIYEVSNTGEIKSLARVSNNKDGEIYLKEKILKKTTNTQGYLTIGLYKNKKRKGYRVHRLVAITFLQIEPGKIEVNHKDGNKSNNHVDNLEWCTPKENTQHAHNNGFVNNPVGKNHIKSKAVIQLDLEGNFIKEWESMTLAKKEGFLSSHISRCCKGILAQHKGYIWKYAEN